MDSIRWLAAILVLMTIGSASIANVPHPSPGRIPMIVHAPHGVLPAVVHHTGSETVDAYAAALSHPAVLASVPCTCGCMEVLDHKDNLDCYIDEVLRDGTVAFSTHGLYCLVCQWITRDAVDGAEAGLDGAELTRLVLERYGPHS
jgi:hypothetical protein